MSRLTRAYRRLASSNTRSITRELLLVVSTLILSIAFLVAETSPHGAVLIATIALVLALYRAARLERLSVTDDLTRLLNRRGMHQRLAEEQRRLQRHHDPFVVFVLDINSFKQINDDNDHATGDMVLVMLARVLRANLRDMDFIGRTGGDEFLVLLPQTELSDGGVIAENLRQAVATHDFGIGPVSVSIGVAAAPDHSTLADVVVRLADLAMYTAKHSGIDAVSVAPIPATGKPATA